MPLVDRPADCGRPPVEYRRACGRSSVRLLPRRRGGGFAITTPRDSGRRRRRVRRPRGRTGRAGKCDGASADDEGPGQWVSLPAQTPRACTGEARRPDVARPDAFPAAGTHRRHGPRAAGAGWLRNLGAHPSTGLGRRRQDRHQQEHRQHVRDRRGHPASGAESGVGPADHRVRRVTGVRRRQQTHRLPAGPAAGHPGRTGCAPRTGRPPTVGVDGVRPVHAVEVRGGGDGGADGHRRPARTR